MVTNSAQVKPVTLKSIMTTELFIASTLPVAAILIVGVIGTQQIGYPGINIFVPVFLLCTVLVFIGELAILRYTHRTIQAQVTDLIGVCQERIVGNKERRALIPRDNELAVLSRALNSLLDMLQYERPDTAQRGRPLAITQSTATRQEIPVLKNQLKRLLDELSPVVDGDLRVKARVSSGDISALADICNYLIEELSQQVRSIRYVTGEVMSTVNAMMDQSIRLARASEIQMVRLSQATVAADRIKGFIQRLGGTLQGSLNIAREAQKSLVAEKLARQVRDADITEKASTNELFKRLGVDMKEQVQILEEAYRSIQDHTPFADSMVGEMYTFAQNVRQSNTRMLSSAEQVGSLITLIEQWQKSVTTYRLAEEDSQELLLLGNNEMDNPFYDSPPTMRSNGRQRPFIR